MPTIPGFDAYTPSYNSGGAEQPRGPLAEAMGRAFQIGARVRKKSRDPIAEAVERALAAYLDEQSTLIRHWMLAVLDAALAPYGGLEAIARLEARRSE